MTALVALLLALDAACWYRLYRLGPVNEWHDAPKQAFPLIVVALTLLPLWWLALAAIAG